MAKKRRTALAAAFDNFNTKVLNPRGMHARIQKAVHEEVIARGLIYSYKKWIAVSMTEEIAVRLNQESVNHKFQTQAKGDAACDLIPI